jgi:hypothetical protein
MERRAALRRLAAKGVAAAIATVVVQDVPIDGGAQPRTGRTARRAADNAFDHHTGRRAQQGTDRAGQETNLGPRHRQHYAAGGTGNGTESPAEPTGSVTRLDMC